MQFMSSTIIDSKNPTASSSTIPYTTIPFSEPSLTNLNYPERHDKFTHGLKMTTYIPALTLPHAVFTNPAASILLPIALGTAVGFSTRRELPDFYQFSYAQLTMPF
jgi:hypothetical protein